MRATTRLAGLVAAAALAVLGACSSEGTSADQESPTVPTPQELAAVLLVEDDLGPEWDVNTWDDDDGVPSTPQGVITPEQPLRYAESAHFVEWFCRSGGASVPSPSWQAGTWLYAPRPESDPQGPYLVELLLAAEPAGVQDQFADIREVMADCVVDVVGDDFGERIETKGEVIEVGEVGADRFAVRTRHRAEMPGVDGTKGRYEWAVLVREGPVLVAIKVIEYVSSETAELPEPVTDVTAIVSTALNKLL